MDEVIRRLDAGGVRYLVIGGQAVTHATENGVPVRCLSRRDLLESKRRANRPEDQADIRFLEARERVG